MRFVLCDVISGSMIIVFLPVILTKQINVFVILMQSEDTEDTVQSLRK